MFRFCFSALHCFDDWNATILQNFAITTTHMAFVIVGVACKIVIKVLNNRNLNNQGAMYETFAKNFM